VAIQLMRVGVQHHEARDRDRARDHARGERAHAKVVLQLAVLDAGGVGGEEHGGEICGGGDGQHADEDRDRPRPARERVSRRVANGYPARGDRADDRAERERREDRGEREHGVDRSPLARA